MLQIVMMFLLYICVASAEDLSEPTGQEQLPEKANHHRADSLKEGSQFNNRIMREDATDQQQKKKQERLSQIPLSQPKNALPDSKSVKDLKEEGPPFPPHSGKGKSYELKETEALEKTKLPKLSFEGRMAPSAMKPLKEGGPSEPWEKE